MMKKVRLGALALSLNSVLLGVLAPQSISGQIRTEEPRRQFVHEIELSVPDTVGFLNEVSTVLVGVDRIWIIDPSAKMIFAFDSTGHLLEASGGEGDGPGEYRWPVLGGVKGRDLWVWDMQLSRITVLNDRLAVQGTSPARSGYTTALLNNHNTLLYPFRLRRSKIPLLRGSEDGEILDTLAILDAPPPQFTISINPEVNIRVGQPFKDNPVWAVSPTGESVVVVDRDLRRVSVDSTFHVVRLSPEGDTLFAVTYRINPIPLTPALQEKTVDDLAQRVTARFRSVRQQVHPGLRREILTKMDLPRYLPPVQSVMVDSDERSWIRLSTEERSSPSWLVLDPSGSVAFSVEWTAEASVAAAKQDRAWLVSVDTFGVSHVHQFRLVSPGWED